MIRKNQNKEAKQWEGEKEEEGEEVREYRMKASLYWFVLINDLIDALLCLLLVLL